MISKNQRRNYAYKLWVDDSLNPGMICIRSDDKEFDDMRFYDDNKIEKWPEGITFYVDFKYPEDILIGGIHWVLVSDKVRQTFEQNGIAGVEFLPVWVEDSIKGEKIGRYWAIHVTTSVEALDWELTRWLYPERVETYEYPVLNIVKEVLKSHIVDELNIFRIRVKGNVDTNIYLSRKLKRYLEKANAVTGFKFIPVEIRP